MATKGIMKVARQITPKVYKIGGKIFRETTEQAVTEGSEKIAKEAAENMTKKSFKNQIKNFAGESLEIMNKNRLKTLGGAAVLGGGGYLLIDALVKKDAIAKTDYNIQSIEDNSEFFSTTYTAKIIFSPGQQISPKDTITISGSNSVPSVDGTYTPSSIDSTTQFRISIPKKITKAGTQAAMKISTSYNSQLSQNTKETGQVLGGAVGAVSGAAASGALGAAGSVGSGILDSLGISTTFFIIMIVCLMLMLCSSSAMFIALR